MSRAVAWQLQTPKKWLAWELTSRNQRASKHSNREYWQNKNQIAKPNKLASKQADQNIAKPPGQQPRSPRVPKGPRRSLKITVWKIGKRMN